MKVETDVNLIQHAFNKFSTFFTFSTMLDDLFKRTKYLVQQSVECKVKQMLKPFKRALTACVYVLVLKMYNLKLNQEKKSTLKIIQVSVTVICGR